MRVYKTTFLRVWVYFLVAVGLILEGKDASAQYFGLGVTSSANPVLTNTPFSFSVAVTNITGSPLNSYVTNELSGPVQLVSVATNSVYASVYSTNSTNATFTYSPNGLGYAVLLTVTVMPTAAGYITNHVTAVLATGIASVDTNVVVLATNTIAPTNASADLAISLSGPISSVIANDWMTYNIAITNLGTNDATSVVLSNMLPAGVRYISVWPPNLTPTEAGSNVVFNLGTIPNTNAAFLALRVQPTNSGTLTFSSVVGSVVPDPNPTNNVASTSIVVTNFLAGAMTVSLVDATQQFDFQTGLMQQRVSLMNVDTNPINFARVTVSGMTNWMFNAAGTNNGNPYVVYPATLNTNESVQLLLEYFNPFGAQVTFTSLVPNEVPFVSLAPPAMLGAQVDKTNINVIQLANGDVMLEFKSLTNQGYTILYYDYGVTTNVMAATPSYNSPANWAEWIDYGPPKTITHPMIPTNTSRSYGVFQNP